MPKRRTRTRTSGSKPRWLWGGFALNASALISTTLTEVPLLTASRMESLGGDVTIHRIIGSLNYQSRSGDFEDNVLGVVIQKVAYDQDFVIQNSSLIDCFSGDLDDLANSDTMLRITRVTDGVPNAALNPLQTVNIDIDIKVKRRIRSLEGISMVSTSTVVNAGVLMTQLRVLMRVGSR